MNRMDQKIRKAFENATPNVLGSVLSDCQPRKGDATKMKNKTNRKPWIGIASTAAALVLLVGVCAAAAGIIGSGFTLGAGGATGQTDYTWITQAEAEEVACSVALSLHPEINNVAVSSTATTEMVDGTLVYSVDARYAGFVHEFKIDGATGAVLDFRAAPIPKQEGDSVVYDKDACKIAENYVIEHYLQSQWDPGNREMSTTISYQHGSNGLEYLITVHCYDYLYTVRVDAYTGEILSVKKEQTEIPDSTEGPGIETSDMIGSGKALNAALAHARLTEDQLTGVTVTLWEDKGISFYNISFTAGTDHYHYKIDAYTEAVLAFEKEPEGVVDPDPPVIGQIMIEREKAVDIALADAGYAQEQTSDLQCALLEEGGQFHYCVKFSASLYWYQYELEPYTGEILSRNREKFMEDKIEPPDGKISESLALMFALEHAGLKEEQITDYSCQFDTETGGRYHYDIQFTAGGYRYEYEVHAYSTEILKSEKTPVG